MIELVHKRRENSKTFDLGGGKRGLEVSIGAIHYKDNYADNSEQWKDIDLTWDGNRITRAPYELTLEGNKVTVRDKKTREVSTIELLNIGGQAIPAQAWEKAKGLAKAFDTDLEIVAGNSQVKFTRILKSDTAPKEAKYKVTGNIPLRVRASDEEDELPVEWSLKDGILTENLKPDRPLKYPIRIDPTLNLQVGASTDDIHVTYNTSTPAWAVKLTGPNCRVGRISALATLVGCGMRFLNVTIPNGATITTAYLTMTANANLATVTINSQISGHDADDSATFSDFTDYKNRRGIDGGTDQRTTAQVAWDAIAAWSLDEEGADTTSPEIKTIIQELLNSGHLASEVVVLFWDDHDGNGDDTNGDYRSAYSYNGDNAKAPKLHIEYTIPVYASLVLVGTVASASRVLASDRDSTTIIGNLVSASRALAATRQSATLLGIVTTASRIYGHLRQAATIIGNLVTATRGVLTTTRTSSTIVGVVPSATRTLTITNLSSVITGIVSTASGIFGRVRVASGIVGVVVTAKRAKPAFIRLSSVIVGTVVTASGVAGVKRAIVYIGVKVTATRNITKVLATAVTVVGVKITASRVAGIIRTALTLVGEAVSAVHPSLGKDRAASVFVGAVASASRTMTTTRASSVMVSISATASRGITVTRKAVVKVGTVVFAFYALVGKLLKMVVYGKPHRDMAVYARPYYDMGVFPHYD